MCFGSSFSTIQLEAPESGERSPRVGGLTLKVDVVHLFCSSSVFLRRHMIKRVFNRMKSGRLQNSPTSGPYVVTDRRDPALSLTGSHYPACHRFLRRSSTHRVRLDPGLFTVKCCSPIPTQTSGAQSRTPTRRRNPADITESLASPLWRPQRLRLALSNQRIHNRHVDAEKGAGWRQGRGEGINAGASSAL